METIKRPQLRNAILECINEGQASYDNIQFENAKKLRSLINPNYIKLKEAWKTLYDLSQSSFVESDPELKSDFGQCERSIYTAIKTLGFINRKLVGFSTDLDADRVFLTIN